MADSGMFRTEGGAEIELDVPLSPLFAAQLRRGELVRIDAPAAVVSTVPEPAHTDSKGRWEEYAISRGASTAAVKAASKAQLIAEHSTA